MKSKKVTLKSWLKVYKQKSQLTEVNSYKELYAALTKYSKTIGSLHSYNKGPFADKTIKLGPRFANVVYNPLCQTVTVGAAAKIKDIQETLVKFGRKLPNSGNFFEQTIAGAIIGGTHGFGESSSLCDAVMRFRYIRNTSDDFVVDETEYASHLRSDPTRVVVSLILKTIPTRSYEVTNCVCTLDELDLEKQSGVARSYAILPYSNKKDPVCLIAEYRVNHLYKKPEKKPKPNRYRPWKWWRLKLWWKVDQFFPPLRRWIQKSLSYVKMKPFKTITDPSDYGAIYDPDPGLSRDTLSFTRWSYRPTYTCYNISLFVKPEDVKDFIKYAIAESERIHKTMLRCFIGVRELDDKSNISYAGNYWGPCSAIDLYCSPRHAKYLVRLQKQLQEKFETRPHYGKTYFG